MKSELQLTIPMSRYKREFNSLVKKLRRGELSIVRVSINNNVKLVCLSPERYKMLNEKLSQQEHV